RFREPSQHAFGHSAARLAVGITDVVKEPSPAFEYPVKLLVKYAGIEIAREAKGWRIVNDACEALILEGWHDLVGITHDLMNVGAGKKAARPGIEPGYLLRAGIEFDGDDFPGGFRGFDSSVAQAR